LGIKINCVDLLRKMMKLDHNPANLFFQTFDIHQCEMYQYQTAKKKLEHGQ